ncbi:MAG: hypothetical protein LBH43_16620, partial [Treponema sp.]|nr:hypothetical protein [Treponema sp.]
MKTRKNICGRTFKRCQQAGKKDRKKTLDGYAQTLGLNRGYPARLPADRGKTRHALSGGKSVKYTAKPPKKGRIKACGGKKTGRPEKHHKAFFNALKGIREL